MQIFNRSGKNLTLSMFYFFLLSNIMPFAVSESAPSNRPNLEQPPSLPDSQFEKRFFTLKDSPAAELQEVELPDSVRLLLKSEGAALNRAMLPGFVVHGLGHLYAGDKGTFKSLLLIEIGCVVVGAVGVHWALSGGLSEGNHQASRLESGGETLLYASVVVFVASWLYDVIAVSGKVRQHNQRIIENYFKNR